MSNNETDVLLDFSHLYNLLGSDICLHRWTVVLLVFIASLVYLMHRNRDNLPPGPWSWPLIGHVKYFQHKPYHRLSHLREVYGDVYTLRVGNYRVVVLCSIEAILEGLINQGEALSGRPDFPSLNSLYNDDRQTGVSTADFHEKTQVKKMFLNSSLDSYCSCVENIEDKLTLEVTDVINRFLEIPDSTDPAGVLESACLNVMLTLVFGQRIDPVGRNMRQMLSSFHMRSLTQKFHAVDFVPFLKAFTPREDLDYVKRVIDIQLDNHRNVLNWHKDTYDPQSIRDMTDHLLYFIECGEDRGLIGQTDMNYLLLDLISSGYEGVAVTLTWLLGYMAAHPAIQTEVQKELDRVVGRDRLPSLTNQPYLPFTTAVIFETERIASVYPFLNPHVASTSCTIEGFVLPKGTLVLFNAWSVHHDARYWKHPTKFDPYRFLNDDNTLEIPDHFLPYGAGVRQCSGESLAEVVIFLFFAHLMHQLTVRSTLDNLVMEGEFDFLIRPKPFQLLVTERLDP